MLVACLAGNYLLVLDFDRVNTAIRAESLVEAFHIHISGTTCNLLYCLGVFNREEIGLTQIKILLLTGVFYVAIYGIRCPVCSFFPQDFVNPIHLLQGRLLSNVTP